MAFVTSFVSNHPIISASSFVIGGSAGYGISHHYLDFNDSYAIGAGVASGTSLVLLEAYAVSFIPSIKELVDGAVATTAEVTAPVATATTAAVQGTGEIFASAGDALGSKTLVDAGGFLGAETAKFADDGALLSGNHNADTPEEKAAYWCYVQNPTSETRKLLDDAIAASHAIKEADDPNADAHFISNYENPVGVTSTAEAIDIMVENDDNLPEWQKAVLEGLDEKKSEKTNLEKQKEWLARGGK